MQQDKNIICCGMCQFLLGLTCAKEHKIQYPLITKKHDCPDYLYKPDPKKPADMFSRLEFTECANCAYNFEDRCSGKKCVPVELKDGICQFYHDKNLTCKYAEPYLQYGNQIRNNRCKLDPAKRDGDQKQGWDWNCPRAHMPFIKDMKCYKPCKEPLCPKA